MSPELRTALRPPARTLAAPRTPLVDIAAGRARSARVDSLPAGSGRRYAPVLESAAYEAWLIAWPRGTGLGLHDHAGSSASIVVLQGRLRERYVTPHGLAVRWLRAGDQVDLGADHVHEIVNVDEVEAVSLHVYAPLLGALEFHADTHEIAS